MKRFFFAHSDCHIQCCSFLLSCNYSEKTKWNTNGSAFVNDGYDVVSYFKNNKALKGGKKFTVEWDEHMWLFATKQHADLFMKNP